MYLVGYAVGIVIAKRRVRRGLVPITEGAVDTLVVYLLAGMLIGARLVYVLVYDFAQYKSHPLHAIAIWIIHIRVTHHRVKIVLRFGRQVNRAFKRMLEAERVANQHARIEFR